MFQIVARLARARTEAGMGGATGTPRSLVLNNGGQKIFISFLLCVWLVQFCLQRIDLFLNRKVFSFITIYFNRHYGIAYYVASHHIALNWKPDHIDKVLLSFYAFYDAICLNSQRSVIGSDGTIYAGVAGRRIAMSPSSTKTKMPDIDAAVDHSTRPPPPPARNYKNRSNPPPEKV